MKAAEVSADEFSAVIEAIHAAGASPERWPEAVLAAAHLLNPAEGSELALESLDRLALAAFVVDEGGAVHDLNASARALLREARCVRIARSTLQFDPAASHLAFTGALRAATHLPLRSSLLVLADDASAAHEVAVSPLKEEGALCGDALVVIAPSRPGEAGLLRRVRRLYDLTETEARVMVGLASGATVDDIATRHGVRASTVRAQIRSIFEKTGVNRQSDLVRLALTGTRPVAGNG